MDVANKEQLLLITRFVDQSGMIREDFVEFVLCDTGTSGQIIADKINSLWKSLYLTTMTFEDKDMMGQAICLVSTERLQPSFNMIILRHYASTMYHMYWTCV